MRMRYPGRRLFLFSAAGLAAAGVLGFAASARYCDRRVLARLHLLDRLDVAVADIAGAAEIGRSYRARVGDGTLLSELGARPALLEALEYTCPETRRALVRRQFREDFRTGDILVENRWVVSRSECIIAALRPPAA
ncbi:hypothetical protein [Tropicimonas sp.]|uniref:hypothetical protein n=1 Tax=Tropicimonas sp. TaxID=2067044 RepID=UPI003A899048